MLPTTLSLLGHVAMGYVYFIYYTLGVYNSNIGTNKPIQFSGIEYNNITRLIKFQLKKAPEGNKKRDGNLSFPPLNLLFVSVSL